MKLKIYIDEAGRGPLAGPLYVGAVLPRRKFTKSSYKDSKILSEHQREILYKKIQTTEQKNQIYFSYGIVTAQEIDNFGMTQALKYGILRAVQMILQKIYHQEIEISLSKTLCSCDQMQKFRLQNLFQESSDIIPTMKQIYQIFLSLGIDFEIIVDGNRTFGVDTDLGCSVTPIIHGDALIPEISMASIVAKVLRDHEMIALSSQYPLYNLAKHKGYGTQQHRDLIAQYGPSEIHRKLFLKDYFPEFKKQKKAPSRLRKSAKNRGKGLFETL